MVRYSIYGYYVFIAGNEIDGATLTGLTENMISELLPVMRYRVKLLKLLHDSGVVEQPSPSTSGSAVREADDLEPTHVDTDARYLTLVVVCQYTVRCASVNYFTLS